MRLIEGGVTAARGFLAGGVPAGVKPGADKPDLAMIYSEHVCTAAAVFTKNLVKGAPILVSQEHLRNGRAQAVIANSGNANTANADGLEKAIRMAKIAGEVLDIRPDDVLVASTGVIGRSLPIEPIENAAQALADSLSPEGSAAAAQAIMTTDTVRKEAAVELELGGKTVRIGGISKGSGMIHPNMATMLCFVTTDCAISAQMLHKAIVRAADLSFHRITVDGDSSTNDTFAVLANGLAGNPLITGEDEDFESFVEGLTAVCLRLAKMMAGDGEGATKLIVCRVEGAKDADTANTVSKAIVGSALVKAAIFGEDANFGRVLCALGYAGAAVDVSRVSGGFSSAAGEIETCRNGFMFAFDEEKAAKVLHEKEITIAVNLHDGEQSAEAYGCDLTYDYVKINGDYRT